MNVELTASALILCITVLVSLGALYVSPGIIDRSVLRPYWLVRRREYERLITSGFVHADLGHLLFNMLSFYFFAFPLERRIGTLTFVLLYFVGLAASEWGTYRKHKDNPNYATLGASGAVSAVMFAYVLYYPNSELLLFFLPIPIPAPLFALLYLAYTFYSARNARDRINHDAHLGGALVGLLFVAIRDPQQYQRLLEAFTG